MYTAEPRPHEFRSTGKDHVITARQLIIYGSDDSVLTGQTPAVHLANPNETYGMLKTMVNVNMHIERRPEFSIALYIDSSRYVRMIRASVQDPATNGGVAS